MDRLSASSGVCDRLLDEIHKQTVALALEPSALGPRELAVRFADEPRSTRAYHAVGRRSEGQGSTPGPFDEQGSLCRVVLATARMDAAGFRSRRCDRHHDCDSTSQVSDFGQAAGLRSFPDFAECVVLARAGAQKQPRGSVPLAFGSLGTGSRLPMASSQKSLGSAVPKWPFGEGDTIYCGTRALRVAKPIQIGYLGAISLMRTAQASLVCARSSAG